MNKSVEGIDMQYLIMCRSLTYAQRASRFLERNGIANGIVKAPSVLGANGCAYCVSVRGRKGEKAVELLKNEGTTTGKIYIIMPDGSIEELK